MTYSLKENQWEGYYSSASYLNRFFPTLLKLGAGWYILFSISSKQLPDWWIRQHIMTSRLQAYHLNRHRKSLYRQTLLCSADWGQKFSSIFWLKPAEVKKRTMILQKERNENQQSLKWSCCQLFSSWRKTPFPCTLSLSTRSATEINASYLQAYLFYFALSLLQALLSI